MYRSFAIGAAFAAGLAVSGTAVAAPHACANRTDALAHLAKKYEEAPVAMGLANNGGVLEVLSSDNGSWTIILTMPNGVSCMLATGQSWEAITPVASGSKV